MELKHFIYNEKTIDFEFNKQTDVMVNATQMAKIFDKRIDFFLKTDQTKEFINALEFTPFGGNSEPLKREEIIQTKGQGGTWMHRILALKLAAWLDPRFEVWVFSTIDKILNIEFYEQRAALLERIMTEKAKESKRIELLDKYPELQEFFDLEDKEKSARNRRLKSIKDQIKQLKLEFE